jgi:hypothetical protein
MAASHPEPSDAEISSPLIVDHRALALTIDPDEKHKTATGRSSKAPSATATCDGCNERLGSIARTTSETSIERSGCWRIEVTASAMDRRGAARDWSNEWVHARVPTPWRVETRQL